MNIFYTMNNPAFCAIMLYSYVKAFHRQSKKPVPIIYLFMILPVLLKKDLRDYFASRSRFKSYLTMLDDMKKENLYYSLSGMSKSASATRKLTLDSLVIAVDTKLLTINFDEATVLPLEVSLQEIATDDFGDVSKAIKAAEILGKLTCNNSIIDTAHTFEVRI